MPAAQAQRAMLGAFVIMTPLAWRLRTLAQWKEVVVVVAAEAAADLVVVVANHSSTTVIIVHSVFNCH